MVMVGTAGFEPATPGPPDQCANLGCVLDGRDQPVSWLLHQYESMPGGTRMRSTFRLPAKTPVWFIKALKKHNREEMAQVSVFLPALYEQCVSAPLR